ncbi:hypothetical protein AB0F43_14405 [Kribbella sp. NPDC023972]|uniref:hypothetical protein n=1 Tax=Kribbella sp. NPDC023972 TaxID=3154795 RepID=UPI0033EA1E66
MTTPAPEVTARRNHRSAQRDLLANNDVRPGTGANSTVSPEALTRIAQGAAAAAGTVRPASSPALGDLAATLRAAYVPRVEPGQARGATSAGERPKTGSQQQQRTPGKGGNSL